MQTMVLAPAIDDRYGNGIVASRIGLKTEAVIFAPTEDLYLLVSKAHRAKSLSCVLVDEAQFLLRDQVFQLSDVCDRLDIPVLAYGIRTDFQGEPFEGSKYLLAWADNLKELKAICHCGRKATMVIRRDSAGNTVTEGAQIEIGGNDRYESTCRLHFKEAWFGDQELAESQEAASLQEV